MARELAAVVVMGGLLALSHVIALLLSIPFTAEELQAFEDPNAVTNAIFYFILIVAFSAVVLILVKWRREGILRYFILGAIALTMVFVFSVPLSYAFSFLPSPWQDISSLAATLAVVVGLTYALLKYPEWYIVDAAGLAVAAGVTAIVGISFGVLPALVFLVALAVYDAIAVYKTKHMLTLADAISGLRLPILLVIPKRLPYSFLRQERLREQLDRGEERAAMFMGLGDIIIPGILVVSAFANLPDGVTYLGVGANLLVALITLLGTLVGFSLLMKFVLSGRPQAGLPLLNSGAILGYIVSYYLFYGDLTFGIVI
ncbi:MAG: presenilin family intramembrane aspartyl protease PSH [Thermoplasmata archaeon]